MTGSVPVAPGSCGLTVREFFGDWSGAAVDPADRVPRPRDRAARNTARIVVAAEYEVIGDWIRDGAVGYWVDAANRLAEHYTNTFPTALQRVGTKLPVVTTCWFDLADDDAVIIELPDPESFWAFQLGTVVLEHARLREPAHRDQLRAGRSEPRRGVPDRAVTAGVRECTTGSTRWGCTRGW